MSCLARLRAFLVDWLVRDAYPLWARSGIDPSSGSFVEALDPQGRALAGARRARVHPRQVYAFAEAQGIGWNGDAAGIIERGMSYFTRHYRRADGLFRTLNDAEGLAQDSRALLYDQAFVLLGYASAAAALGARAHWEDRALELRHLIEVHLCADHGAYRSEAGAPGYDSNPHMHLLEACLRWAEIGADPGWAARVRNLVDLALARFVAGDSGAIHESYLPTWQPTPGVSGDSIEPGHQFEWAWLLFRSERWMGLSLRQTALRLIAIAECHGVRGGRVINALRDDLTVSDGGARLWPQCERLKASLFAASLTGEQRFLNSAQSAAHSLCHDLGTPLPGLWFDARSPDGELRGDTVPASTFYHLVSAIVALQHDPGATA